MSSESVGASAAPPETYPTDEANAMPERNDGEEPHPGGYDYGPPPTLVRDSNYISDENLLVWLAQKQDGLYGELRDHMDMSRARSKLMADLTYLKGALDGEMSVAEARAELERLLEQYAGTPFEAELNELLAGALAELRGLSETEEMAADLVGGAFLDRLSTAIESKVDALGRDDQLELVEIQSLTADIREASQLASNLLASNAQASNTIVGNIGR